MMKVPLQGDYVRTGNVATFTLPNPDNPDKPILARVGIVGEFFEFHPDRSSDQRRILASLGL